MTLASNAVDLTSTEPATRLLRLRDISEEQLRQIIRLGIDIKRDPQAYENALHRKGMLLLFEKTSTRTTLSYQSAMYRLGGYAVAMDWQSSNFSISPIRYEAEYASRNCDVIMARLRSHDDVVELADHSQVPVINGCCQKFHPSQALADLMTIYETCGSFDVTLAYVGVHNNIANSLVEAAIMTGMRLVLVTPLVNEQSWDASLMASAADSGLVTVAGSVREAAQSADFIYTDTWVDMENFGDPEYLGEAKHRAETMRPYQLNAENIGDSTPWIMHDMPIHPGYEIDDALVNSPKSIIYRQAENRMHAQSALLISLLT